jgi:hypothetical protein
MVSGERPGLLGALSRTIFGSHQVEEDSSSQDEEEVSQTNEGTSPEGAVGRLSPVSGKTYANVNLMDIHHPFLIQQVQSPNVVQV